MFWKPEMFWKGEKSLSSGSRGIFGCFSPPSAPQAVSCGPQSILPFSGLSQSSSFHNCDLTSPITTVDL
ncbi:hypothetical protein STEG23_020379 [Scotinomys teguina]